MEQGRSKVRRIAIQKGETFPEMDIKEIDRVVAHLVKELGQAKSHIKELEGQLNNVDELLSRRSALDDEPTRCDKIMKAIDTARNADSATARVKELEKGIKKHKAIKNLRGMTLWEGDVELYKLVEGQGGGDGKDLST